MRGDVTKLTKRVFKDVVNFCANFSNVKVAVLFSSPARCVFFADGMFDLVMRGGIQNAYLPYAQETQDSNMVAFRNGSSIAFLRHNGDENYLERLRPLYHIVLVEDGEKDDELDRFIDSLQVIHTRN